MPEVVQSKTLAVRGTESELLGSRTDVVLYDHASEPGLRPFQPVAWKDEILILRVDSLTSPVHEYRLQGLMHLDRRP